MFFIYVYGSLLVVLTIYAIVERKKLKLFRKIKNFKEEITIDQTIDITVHTN